ncbi:MAG: histidine--tRNA ligase [Acidimicrobiaceae bacterium]|nr:histidine--tRNA ligase [Acidimicrobiaceae bacterium]MBT5849209.1 histidine--tRNA ligase [Acidimicrobiaceae bacterium]
MAEPTFKAPKGTSDILPPESGRRRALIDAFAAQAGLGGFGEVMSPIFEDIGVFKRLGESTDVVTKEMFDFFDKGDPPQHLALRPELTASVCRAYAEHRPVPPWKVWYEGPQFRYEQPQAGRYRQFSQVGVETLGTDDPQADVDVIALAWRFYESLGLRQVSLLLNSLGDSSCRPAYIDALRGYLESSAANLSDQSRVTLERNPLRVLDSKRPEDQAVIDAAPLMVDYLSDDTAEHFAAVRSGLDALGIPYGISPRLVRGLDYYTRTTFEFAADALATAQNAVGGGGRYDGLVENLGGPATPGIGFALGVDRILLACDAEDVFPMPSSTVSVFVVDVTGGSHALGVCNELRDAGIGADRSYGGRSMKAQMKVADRSGAPFAAIIGEDEVAAGEVTLRDLRGDTGQHRVALDTLVYEVNQLLAI